MSSLAGKKIFVTGGSRGIGAAICKVLANKGATVGFSYSSREDSARSVLESLPGTGHFYVPMNISQEESIQNAFNTVIEKLGEVDGLVNNAGITKDNLLLRMKTEDFDSVIQTNLKGTFILTKFALKHMLKLRRGSVVNVTSVIGQTGNAGQSNYAASKAGIEAFSKSAALEVASRGIRVNCVAPGFIATEMTQGLNEEHKNKILTQIPLERIAQPEEVAYAIAFLLSDESTYITGQSLNVNGGMYMG